jgi:hypothetical protein
MTKTTEARPVIRETPASHQHRPLIIELHPHFVRMRQKGTRIGYLIDYHQIWKIGAENEWRRRQAERQEPRSPGRPRKR